MIPRQRLPLRHLALFSWMPSPLKRWCYRRLLGYHIGRRVSFGLGSVVVGKKVDIGDDVEVGFLTIIRGKTIKIGRNTQIGSLSYLHCNTIEIGEDARINEQVFVGGLMLPESRFQLGSRTIVMQMSFLNPTKPLIIGDDSGIGGHCLIFTHGSWLNVLHGYPVSFREVTIGQSVWLPWRVFVLPGSTIGDGAVIGANSLVQGDIPARSLAVGSPARVVRSGPEFIRELTVEDKENIVEEIVAEFERFLSDEGVRIGPGRTYQRGRERFSLVWWRRSPPDRVEWRNGSVLLSEIGISAQMMEDLDRKGVSWLDLDGGTRCAVGNPLCEELALFLSRYGIRLARKPSNDRLV
jgi:acetyltransferase-like isoleucine patch superfamily enzyme